jgi:hypothetical protein
VGFAERFAGLTMAGLTPIGSYTGPLAQPTPKSFRTGLGGVKERLPYALRFNIRQLTDVLHCKLQQHFRCNEH